jgi:hypothetical protein
MLSVLASYAFVCDQLLCESSTARPCPYIVALAAQCGNCRWRKCELQVVVERVAKVAV